MGSRPVKDVLELGTHLSRELGIDVHDTLGRWLSHHIAELITRAESAATVEEKARAEAAAIEAILKIWSHRLVLPGSANPFGKYKRALETLQFVKPEGTHWNFPSLSPKGPLIASVSQRIPRLVRGVLALELPLDAEEAVESEKAITEFLDEDERSLLTQFRVRIVLAGEDIETEPKTPLEVRADLQRHLEELISETVTDLEELRKQIVDAQPLGD